MRLYTIKYNKYAFTPLEISETQDQKAKSLTGFTLIEITIALLILTVGLVGILTLFPVGFDAAGRASNITVATFLAQREIEDVKRAGYDSLAIGTFPGDYVGTPYSNYEYEIFVSDVGVVGLLEVVVCVYWPEDAGGPGNREGQRKVELRTYIAKYEP